MSLLTPLYVLGLLAVSLPVMFHLIRRMPRGEFPFSSLMFLSPSPPRLTRRSRLGEHPAAALARGCAVAVGVCVCPAVLAAAAAARRRRRRAAARGDRRRHQRQHAARRPVAAGHGDGRRGAGRVPAARSSRRVHVRRFAAAARGFEDMAQVAPAQRRGWSSHGRLQQHEPDLGRQRTWAAG